jgi:hypothetical protein
LGARDAAKDRLIDRVVGAKPLRIQLLDGLLFYRNFKEEEPLKKIVLLALGAFALTGCRSRFVEATIVNQGPALHVLEFDYPSASFGANQLATGAQFRYRFKIQGDGPLSLQFEDAAGHNHTAAGPNVALGDQGTLLVTITPAGTVTWSPNLNNPK